MKKLLLLALCAVLSANADARTIYVNASRPNNKGNGLSARKAKKTLQAAINVARRGDTILVYPGSYAPIKTNNKKIAIKSTKGKARTTIAMPKSASEPVTIAMLGKPCVSWRYYGTGGYGSVYSVKEKSKTDSWGNSTRLSGFVIDGGHVEQNCFAGVTGGTVLSSTIRYIMSDGSGRSTSVARSSKLVGCTLSGNRYGGSRGCFDYCSKFDRCRIVGNSGTSSRNFTPFFDSSTLVNCLVADNGISPTAGGYCDDSYALFFDLNCLVVNCTIAENHVAHSSQDSVFSWETRFYNSVLWNNTDQHAWETAWDDEVFLGAINVHNFDPGLGNVYKNTNKTNRDPKLTSAYKPRKGSYCIDSGKLTKKQKKLVGTKDLAGKKRIRGKAIDRGCYEH